jgi:hypothetical protein
MGAELGSLPGLGVLSHLGGTAFGTTAHAAVHGAVHDTFMTLPAYTRTSEGEVHELGLGVRSCLHSARSDPLSEKRERIERACEGTSAEGTARCASRGNIEPKFFVVKVRHDFHGLTYCRRIGYFSREKMEDEISSVVSHCPL